MILQHVLAAFDATDVPTRLPGGQGTSWRCGSAVFKRAGQNGEAEWAAAVLIDNRDVIRTDWAAFDRIVIEGRAETVPSGDPRFSGYIEELRAKNRMAAYFTEQGQLFCVQPRRLVLMKGFEPTRNVVDWESE